MADISEVRGNLRADLSSDITDTATSLAVNDEFTNKTVPLDGYLAIGEQQDFTDGTFEVVRYSGFTRNGDGTSTFSSLSRGLDNTSASSWSSGITVGTNIPGNLLARIPQQQESLDMGGNSITNQLTSDIKYPHHQISQLHNLGLPLEGSWTDYSGNPLITPGSWVSDGAIHRGHIIYHDGTWYCYYEALMDSSTTPNQYRIGLHTASSLTGTWTDNGSAVVSEGSAGDIDEYGVADPSVVITEDGTWHMFFDTYSTTDADRVVAKATSSDGVNWTKYDDNGDGETDIIIDQGGAGEWDGSWVHAPHVVRFMNSYLLFYNAKGSGHSDWLAGLAYADNQNLNSFTKFGRITSADSVSTGEGRLQEPFIWHGKLYATIDYDTGNNNPVLVSPDLGKTWQEVGQSPTPSGEGAESVFIHDGRLWTLYSDGNNLDLAYKELN